MTETSMGFGGPTPSDRLSQLRAPNSTVPAHQSTRRRVRIEVWAGALLALVGVALLVVARGNPDRAPIVASNPTATTTVSPGQASPGGLLAGEALYSFAVDDGDYPPSLGAGDQIRLVVTPGNDGTGVVRTLREQVVVVSVDGPTDMGTRRVVTVRGPENLLTDLAASGPVHVAIVNGGPS